MECQSTTVTTSPMVNLRAEIIKLSGLENAVFVLPSLAQTYQVDYEVLFHCCLCSSCLEQTVTISLFKHPLVMFVKGYEAP